MEIIDLSDMNIERAKEIFKDMLDDKYLEHGYYNDEDVKAVCFASLAMKNIELIKKVINSELEIEEKYKKIENIVISKAIKG